MPQVRILSPRLPRDARSQLAAQPPESGGFFVWTGSGALLQSQHGARSMTTTRCGVDETMQNGNVPITRPRALHGAFLCARSGVDAWAIAPGISPVTPRHICSRPWSPIRRPRARSCWRGLRHPSHTEAWPGDMSGRSLDRISVESSATQRARVKRSLRERDGWVCQ